MLRGFLNLLASSVFVTLLPIFWLCAQFWGSQDERWLMRVCMLTLSPLCAAIWLIILRKGKWSSLLVIPLGYVVIALLLRSGLVRP
jgi:hypothetical protein